MATRSRGSRTAKSATTGDRVLRDRSEAKTKKSSSSLAPLARAAPKAKAKKSTKSTRVVPSAPASRTTVPRSAIRAQLAVEALGGPTRVGELLGVASSQPSRWARGEAVPGPESARLLADLDHVIAVAEQVWDPSLVAGWLIANNPHLGDARPIDVARVCGSAPVIDALRAEAAGAFA